MAQGEHQVKFETSVAEPEEDKPPRLFVWVRQFQGDEELTGRYEVFGDLASFDEFIARYEAAGEDISTLRTARESFADTLEREA
ncbi:MAG TPA: hypothetical protein VE685_12380 [Thermoanaerobaculia bacterium]|nr:hypothetical protein [Thermoanaerobaculia bacterium]